MQLNLAGRLAFSWKFPAATKLTESEHQPRKAVAAARGGSRKGRMVAGGAYEHLLSTHHVCYYECGPLGCYFPYVISANPSWQPLKARRSVPIL